MSDFKYWGMHDSIKNFGDVLSTHLRNRLLEPSELKADGSSVWLLGSVIDDGLFPPDSSRAFAQDHIFWTCGLRSEASISQSNLARSIFPAVRGPLTRDALGLDSSTPIGDFALLTRIAYPELVGLSRGDRTILIPHFSDSRSDEELISLAGVSAVIRPQVSSDEESTFEVLSEIATSRMVLCGALHAAIVAASLGVDFAYWDSGNVDIPFKWYDFSSSIQIPARFHTNVESALSDWDRKSYSPRIPSLTNLLLSSPILPKQSAISSAITFDLATIQQPGELEKFSGSIRHAIQLQLSIKGSLAASALNYRAGLLSTELNLTQTQQELTQTQQELTQTQQELTQTQQELTQTQQELTQTRQELKFFRSKWFVRLWEFFNKGTPSSLRGDWG